MATLAVRLLPQSKPIDFYKDFQKLSLAGLCPLFSCGRTKVASTHPHPGSQSPQVGRHIAYRADQPAGLDCLSGAADTDA